MFNLKTKNSSFIKVSQKLKQEGVKNFNFMLELKDADLLNVDPHDETLSDEIKNKIYTEIQENPWYYFREVARIPNSGKYVPFRLSLASAAFFYLKLNDLSVFLLTSRQTGKTLNEILFETWINNFSFRKTKKYVKIEYYSCGSKSTTYGLYKKIVDAYPQWLIDRTKHEHEIEKKEKEKINKTITGWFDDFSFLNNSEQIWHNFYRTFLDQEDKAPYSGITITTTANKKESPTGEFAHHIYLNSEKFNMNLYDLSKELLVSKYNARKYNPFVLVSYDYDELLSKDTIDSLKKSLSDDTINSEIYLRW